MMTGAETAPFVFGRLFKRLRNDRVFFHRIRRRFDRNPQYFNALEVSVRQLAESVTAGGLPNELAASVGMAFTMMTESKGAELPALAPGALNRLLARFQHLPPNRRQRECEMLWEKYRTRLDQVYPGIVDAIRRAIIVEKLEPCDDALIFASLGIFFTLYFEAQEEIERAVLEMFS